MDTINIKVLGPGCKNCKTVFERTEAVVKKLEIEAQLEYVKDLAEINKYVMLTPGLVVNESIVHQGKPLPSEEKIKSLIQKFISQAD